MIRNQDQSFPIPMIIAASIVAAAIAFLTVPATMARWWLTQDAVEHLAIAHAWVQGAGFVDPVQWTYPSSGELPYPATSMRAPGISLLAALPLVFGADLTTTHMLHALFASAVSGFVLVAARRCGLRWPAAWAATLVATTAPAWLGIALHLWTEAAALLAFLVVLLTARGVVESVARALLCAGATFAAVLVRPNFLALAAAVVCAGLLEPSGRRRAARRPLIAYAVGLGLAVLCFRGLVALTTGEAPYSRYAPLFEVMTTSDAWQYGRASPDLPGFLANHGEALFERTRVSIVDLVRVLGFEWTYHGLGWLVLPGFAWALVRDDDRALELRFLALAGLGLAVIGVGWLDFDRIRFPLFTAIAASICGFAMIEALALRLDTGALGASGRLRRALRLVPLAVAIVPLASTLPSSIERSIRAWRAHRAEGTREMLWPEQDASIRPLCRVLDPDAIVASVDPWTTHLWCGNAGLVLPTDLDRSEVLEAFLENERPGYLIGFAADRALREGPRLRRIARSRDLVVYEVRSAGPDSRPWRAPPPLFCAGRPTRCPGRTPSHEIPEHRPH